MVNSEEHKQVAREVAREGTVLLKNTGVLPLGKDLKNVAVIGPNADVIYNYLGDYTAPQERSKVVTLLDAIRQRLPNANVYYEKVVLSVILPQVIFRPLWKLPRKRMS